VILDWFNIFLPCFLLTLIFQLKDVWAIYDIITSVSFSFLDKYFGIINEVPFGKNIYQIRSKKGIQDQDQHIQKYHSNLNLHSKLQSCVIGVKETKMTRNKCYEN